MTLITGIKFYATIKLNMKKQLIILVLFCLFFAFNVKGQAIRESSIYLKQLNYFWGITNSFSKVHSAYDKQSENLLSLRNEQIDVITTLLTRSKPGFEKLKASFQNNKEVEEVEQIRKALEKNLENLKGNNWRSQPMWQMMNSLVQMKLEERV